MKGKQQIFEKLEKFNENANQTDDQELNLLIDSLRVIIYFHKLIKNLKIV